MARAAELARVSLRQMRRLRKRFGAGVPAGRELTVAARRVVTLAGSGWSVDEAAGPDRWGDRVVGPPTCRAAWAAAAESGPVGASWRRVLGRLGLAGCPRLGVLAGGARWIWDGAAERFKAVVDSGRVAELFELWGGCGSSINWNGSGPPPTARPPRWPPWTA